MPGKQIEEEAARTVKRSLAARRVIDVSGPLGCSFASVTTGHVAQITAPADGARAGLRTAVIVGYDQEVPADLAVHLICDNHSTHESPVVKTWLAAHPRVQMHFTPTYSSWLNQVVRLFAFVTEDLLQRSHHAASSNWKQTSAAG